MRRTRPSPSVMTTPPAMLSSTAVSRLRSSTSLAIVPRRRSDIWLKVRVSTPTSSLVVGRRRTLRSPSAMRCTASVSWRTGRAVRSATSTANNAAPSATNTVADRMALRSWATLVSTWRRGRATRAMPTACPSSAITGTATYIISYPTVRL